MQGPADLLNPLGLGLWVGDHGDDVGEINIAALLAHAHQLLEACRRIFGGRRAARRIGDDRLKLSKVKAGQLFGAQTQLARGVDHRRLNLAEAERV